jgi:hypothetical protein
MQGCRFSHLKGRWLVGAFMKKWIGGIVEWSRESCYFFIAPLVLPKSGIYELPFPSWLNYNRDCKKLLIKFCIIDVQDQNIYKSPNKPYYPQVNQCFSSYENCFHIKNGKNSESCTSMLFKLVSYFLFICGYLNWWMFRWNWECIPSTFRRIF